MGEAGGENMEMDSIQKVAGAEQESQERREAAAAESAPLSGLFSPAHSGSLQSTDGSSISKQPIP